MILISQEQRTNSAAASAAASAGPTFGDLCFLLLMCLILLVVAVAAVRNYESAVRVEVSKVNGEAWVKWLTDSGRRRFAASDLPQACAGAAQTAVEVFAAGTAKGASPGSHSLHTWGQCFEAIRHAAEPVALQVNSHTGQPVTLAAKCDGRAFCPQKCDWQARGGRRAVERGNGECLDSYVMEPRAETGRPGAGGVRNRNQCGGAVAGALGLLLV